ncbi:4Fe-4S ferredoxin [Desulfoplanes formicivorans]|uniref:4Fe-4S ferredoxin n=2 Tax=Desulfoplanes formicivorans TaxID=1592317 RepID=A0A194AHC6_9BACT|nr:4Fe-4S ferredoxin [Desulfoplanes formicivorans]
MPTILLTITSIVLLAAHTLRWGEAGMAVSLVLFATLMGTRRQWVRLAALPVLVWGLFIWSRTGIFLLHFRMAADLPWVRLAVIMTAVMSVTLLGLLGLAMGPGRRFFVRQPPHDTARAAVFILTAGLLLGIRHLSAIPLLLADRFIPGLGPLEIFALALYAVWVCGRLLEPKTQASTRRVVWLLFSVIFFAQLFLGLLGMESFLMTGKLHLPVPALILAGPLFRGEGWFMPILFGSTLLMVGPAWCSHLCYIGAWDHCMAQHNRPHPLPGWTRILRWSILVLVVLTALLLRFMQVPAPDAAMLAGMFGLIGIGIMILVSRRMGTMVHCTTFCPIGILGNYLGKLAPWRMRIASSCTRCTTCFRACRYNALDLSALSQGKPHTTCTLCGDCASACPHGALTFSAPLMRPARARQLFMIVVTTLHTLFLGVARI